MSLALDCLFLVTQFFTSIMKKKGKRVNATSLGFLVFLTVIQQNAEENIDLVLSFQCGQEVYDVIGFAVFFELPGNIVPQSIPTESLPDLL